MFQRHTLLVGTSILAGFLGVGSVAQAQEVSTPMVEIGASYSWLHVNSANNDYHRTGNGGSGYVEYNFNKWVGLVTDIGGYANTRVDDKALTYMIGPRFNWRHSRLTPYFQTLFGGVYAWTNPKGLPSSTQNAFAAAVGGGLDYQVTNRIAIKPIQVEYVRTELNSALGFGSHQNDIRYSAGVVLRFGEK